MLLTEIKALPPQDNLIKELESKIIDISLYSILWGIGAILDEESRAEFNIFLLKLVYFEDVWNTYNL